MNKSSEFSRLQQECDVVVIIPLFNESNQIDNLYSSLLRQKTAFRYRVLLVDNGSTDGTLIRAKKYFTTILCAEPGSYAARNRGIESSTEQYILFTDGDCLPSEEWVENMVRRLVRGACVVAGVTLPLLRNRGDFLDHLLRYRFEYYGGPMINETAWSSSCSFPTCNVAYHRSVFREAGAFSNHTGGDVEMSARAYKRGFSCVIAHDAIVYHSPPDSVMELIGKFIRYGERPGGSILELLSSILIIILFPVVFVSHFLITLSKRSSRAKSLRVPIVYFAIFEAVRLVLANIGFIKSYLRTTNRVY